MLRMVPRSPPRSRRRGGSGHHRQIGISCGHAYGKLGLTHHPNLSPHRGHRVTRVIPLPPSVEVMKWFGNRTSQEGGGPQLLSLSPLTLEDDYEGQGSDSGFFGPSNCVSAPSTPKRRTRGRSISPWLRRKPRQDSIDEEERPHRGKNDERDDYISSVYNHQFTVPSNHKYRQSQGHMSYAGRIRCWSPPNLPQEAFQSEVPPPLTNGAYTYASYGQSPRRTPLPQVHPQVLPQVNPTSIAQPIQTKTEMESKARHNRFRSERTLSMPSDPFDLMGFEEKYANTRTSNSMMMGLGWSNNGLNEFQPIPKGHFRSGKGSSSNYSTSEERQRKDSLQSEADTQSIYSLNSITASSPCMKRISRPSTLSLESDRKVLGLPPLPSKSKESSYEQLKLKLKEVSDKCFSNCNKTNTNSNSTNSNSNSTNSNSYSTNSNSNSNSTNSTPKPSKLKLFSRFYKNEPSSQTQQKDDLEEMVDKSLRKMRSLSFGGITSEDVIYDEEDDTEVNFDLRVNPLYGSEGPLSTSTPVDIGMTLDDFKDYDTQMGGCGGSGSGSNNSDGDSGIVNETLDSGSIFLESDQSQIERISGERWNSWRGGSKQGLVRPNTPIRTKNFNNCLSTAPNTSHLQGNGQGEYKLVRIRKFPPFQHPFLKTKSMFNGGSNSDMISSSSTLELGVTLDKNLDETSACGYVVKTIHPESPIARG